MSFIDLLDVSVWSEADIVNRTEAMLHGEVSRQDELILSRKMIAFSMGRLIPTADEAELLGRYEAAAYAAQLAGTEARADMALKSEAMAIERGEIDPADASPEALALVALRNPPQPEPEPVPEPEPEPMPAEEPINAE